MTALRPIDDLAATLGLSTHAEAYRYGSDPRFGITAEARIPERWVPTTCGYCSVGCGMLIGVRDGKAVSVRGDPEHPVNEGKLCPKGLCEHHTLAAPGRALYPMLRRGWNGLRRVDWDEALDHFVAEAGGVQTRHGKESFAVLSTGQLVTEEFYALGKLVQLGFRTPNYDGNTTLCMASAVAGYKRSFGSDGPPGSYEDLEQADVVVLIGANIADNHPILAYRLLGPRRKPGQKLIVVDPRATKTAMHADLFLPLRPRSDVYLLNGLAHLLISEGWVDEDYVRAHTRGYEELRDHLASYTLAHVAEVTRLSQGQIYEAARAIGTARSAFLAWTMGVNHSTQGTETVNAINNLALLTGNVGRPGGSAFSITGQCNAMGSRETSFTSSLPGYRKFESEPDRRELAALWRIDEQDLPRQRGYAYPDIIQAILDGRVKGLWIIATNPLVSYPDQKRLRAALAKLELLVVQDGYHPMPTSEIAHLVLPAAIWGEKEGTYTNSERRVSKVNKAVEPPGAARSDFEIFLELGRRLGVAEEIFPGWREPRDAFEEWRRVSRGRLCDYSAMSYERLAEGSIQWPAGAESPEGAARLYADGRFASEDGKATLFCVRSELPPEEPDAEFPLLLNTGRTVEHWHTRTKTGRIPILERSAPDAWIELNPRDALALGVRNHDWVSVRSRRGEIERIRARVTSIVGPGQVFIPFHYAETCANNLTIDACDPISREPNYKQCAVRVEKLRRF